MATFRNLPELVRINGKWVFDYFEPTQPAFDWPSVHNQTGILYLIGCADHVKIGITRNFEKRFFALNNSNPLPLKRISTRTVPLAGMAYAEAWMHRKFADWRVKGEWFAIDGKTAKSLLPQAVKRAEVYAAYCRNWHLEEQRNQKPLTPKEREQMEACFARAKELKDAAYA